MNNTATSKSDYVGGGAIMFYNKEGNSNLTI